jgi:hypothetical protein
MPPLDEADGEYQFVEGKEMKPFPIISLLELVRDFQQQVSDPAIAEEEMDKEFALEQLAGLAAEYESNDLDATAAQLRRISDAVERGATRKQIVTEYLPATIDRILDDCNRQIVMAVEPRHRKHFADAKFFDPDEFDAPKVSTAFPSATYDIEESGICLACGRATACVMHLNKIVEVGLRTLAHELGIAEQNDWGAYLRLIDKALDGRREQKAEDQFYAEAKVTIDAVRRAWRNPTMHVEKVYQLGHAEDILNAVRAFMRHLATQIHE